MSISSELLTLQNTKTAIRTAINNKGGSVGASDTFASYATAIDNLPSGGSGNPLLTSIDVSDFSGTTFNRAANYITDVTIPSGVTSIGQYAFQFCSSLTSINIPSGVTSIGNYAFQYCSALTSINIPSGVSIGQYAFSDCTGLTGNMDIKGISYADRSFNNCTGLTSLTFTDSNASIGYAVFDGCTSVTSVNVDSLDTWCHINFSNVTNLPTGNPLSLSQEPTLYVNGTAITGVLTIPNTVTALGNGSFAGYKKITSLSLPNTLTSIGDYTFKLCTGLTTVTIPNGVTTIGQYTFTACTGLTTVTIPDSVTTIGQYAFSDTNSPIKVTIGSGITRLNTGAFQNVGANGSVTIKKTTPPTLSGGYVFWGSYPIYVPAESLDTYKAASGWSTYASRIYPITQVATVDGNPVYNYEIGNKDATVITDTERSKIPTGDSIEFAEGVTQIGGQLGAYEEVILPSTFTSFNDTQPINAATTTLTSKATTPPSVERSNLGGSGLTAIYVPASAVDTYKAHAAWGTFSSIIQAIPSPTPSVTSITFAEYQEQPNPADFGDFAEYDGTEVLVDSFLAASDDSTFDSDIKAAGIVLVEDNNGNDITSQCTFTSSDFTLWDSTQDPDYDGESEPYYEWRLTTTVTSGDEQSPHSATITATYGNLSDTFTIEWTTTSNGEPEE